LASEFGNSAKGKTYGLEVAASWQASNRTHFDLAYSFQESDLKWISDPDIVQNTDAPRHQLSFRSHFELMPSIELDLWFRYTDSIRVFSTITATEPTIIEGYVNLDARLAWRPKENIELSLVGQNLLDDHHLEYIQESFIVPTEVDRGVFLQLRVDF